MSLVSGLARDCEVCVEFGVRRANSTVALLSGCPGKVYSYDLEEPPGYSGLYAAIGAAVGERWEFMQKNVLEVVF